MVDGSITIGSDEVGWGAVAGSLYVVGVAMPSNWRFRGLQDSKKYKGKNARANREAIFEPLLKEVKGCWALAIFSAEQVDTLGAQHCLIEAHTSVLQQLVSRVPRQNIERVIVDGKLRLPKVPTAVAIPEADSHFQVVSAASVIAKVLHDDAMMALANSYPQYGFDEHMGYGTPAHMKAIRKHGMCPMHRRSYLKRDNLNHETA